MDWLLVLFEPENLQFLTVLIPTIIIFIVFAVAAHKAHLRHLERINQIKKSYLFSEEE